jgi:hypothetical protein
MFEKMIVMILIEQGRRNDLIWLNLIKACIYELIHLFHLKVMKTG